MSNIKELDKKYAKLLLTKCLSFNNSDTLLVECPTHENDGFVETIVEEAKKMGIKEIDVKHYDADEIHDYLMNTDIDDIKLNPLFDKSTRDIVSKKYGCFIHIHTFIPNLMDDVDPNKILKMNKLSQPTYTYYRANAKYNFPWVICSYPNERWAKYVFGDDPCAYMKLYAYIINMCMVDREDPVLAWDNYIKELNVYKNKMQDMNIEKLYYKNDLGTDFEIGLPKDHRWLNLDKKDNFGSPIIVNMPSYEIFATPDYRTANGIVYNSRPLVFSNNIIDKFYVEFKDGVAVNYKAQIGDEYLKQLIEGYSNSNRLGEVALVNNDSPISNTGIVFYNTLFDENASCHLAFGQGSAANINNYKNLSKEELENMGVNYSNVHVDFMIGTPDLEISADTNKGKQKIFTNGNFSI